MMGFSMSGKTQRDFPEVDEIGKFIDAFERGDFDAYCWHDLSEGLRQICEEADDEIRTKAMRVISLWRWRDKAAGPVEIIDKPSVSPELYWRLETSGKYQGVPRPEGIFACIDRNASRGFDPRTIETEAFNKLWAEAKCGEPLGHQMLREALQISHHSPNAALLISYSALEVGLKQHLSTQIPGAEWILKEAPTPPVPKIFKHYLPEVHGCQGVFKIAGERLRLWKTLEEFTKARNALAHRGTTDEVKLVIYLQLTQNLLYLLDWLAGHTWAEDNFSPEFRNAFCPKNSPP